MVAVCRADTHRFSKAPCDAIRLVAGRGVDGDAHEGETVQHLSRVKRDPTAPNLRQVHLLHRELHDELNALGFKLTPGLMGENLLTLGIDLLGLPTRACLHVGEQVIIGITGLRNPCHQLDVLRPGLMAATLATDQHGNLQRRAGVMAIVIVGGIVRPGDEIGISLPDPPYEALQPV